MTLPIMLGFVVLFFFILWFLTEYLNGDDDRWKPS